MDKAKSYEANKADLEDLVEKLKSLSKPQLMYIAGAVDLASAMRSELSTV